MAASSSSSHHHQHHRDTMKLAAECLHSFLTHYGRLEEGDRLSLINKIQEAFMLQPTNEQYPDYQVMDDSMTTSDARFVYWKKRFSKIEDTLNSCWSTTELNPAPSSSPAPLPLEPQQQQYLLYFSLLGSGGNGDDTVVTRRQLIYWWVAQGLIDAETEADDELGKLVDAGAIEQVTDQSKRRKTTRYRLIRKPSEEFLEGELEKVGVIRQHRTHPGGPTLDGGKQLALIETLYNDPDVSILNIPRDWLQKMKSLKVVHLGSWSSDGKRRHMAVETVEFLQAFKALRKVRYISLRGLSTIMKLGEEICSLGDSLRVLDLRDCSNLETLPEGIWKLKNLTHLDLSECFLLDRIPRGIIYLTKLQVLKGFVITDVQTSSASCNFRDLATHLGKTLTKLSIRTRRVSFPVEDGDGDGDDLKAFSQFEKLLKLKIEWVRIPSTDYSALKGPTHTRSFKGKMMLRSFRSRGANVLPGLPEQLQKLEVHDIPQAAVQSLMLRKDHKNLVKLYIIGGQVSDLVAQGEVKWESVETLRLKHLAKLHMSWMQLEVSFPKIAHLEAVRCPFLSFLPCDSNGIWKRRQDV